MNQEQNNLNQNNFNSQGNNGIPNNQPLNNQNVTQDSNASSLEFNQQIPQTMSDTFESRNSNNQNLNVSQTFNPQSMQNYQQPINQMNIQQPTSQPVNNSFENVNFSNQSSNNKPQKKMNTGLIIGIVVAIVIVIVGIVLVPNLSNKGSKVHNLTNEKSNVIIVNNKDNKNALFNVDGKQLTEFYDEITEFRNDIAIVKNNNEYAVINSKGKFIINFKEYSYITFAGFIIRAKDEEYNYNLIDNNGKKIKVITDGEILDYWGYDKLIIIENDKDYEILNPYTGSLIKKITKADVDDLKVYDGEYDLTYVYYNNKTYIINYKTGKIINELTGEKQINSINSINNTQYVILEKSDNTFEYYNNDKQVFATKECTNLFFDDNNNLICAVDYDKRYLMDNNGKKTIEIYKSSIAYLDSENYAINENNSTIFYVDGKKIKEIKDTIDVYTISRSNKIYELKTKTDSDYKYQFYNFKGELISDQYFTNALGYDETNLAIVSSNKKDFYLIDIKGNKVSKDYDSIRFDNPLYVAQKNNIYYILDTKGKEIMQKEGTTNDFKIYDNFFTISENKKLAYYTLKGKEFYTINY